ncbi:MAG: hypothetical protein AAF196_17885 [Planctomycetota bacterium]
MNSIAQVLGVCFALGLPTDATAQRPSCGNLSLNPNVGTGQGSGDEVLSSGLSLGFPFTFPDGTVTSVIDVTSNGRIVPTGGLMATSFSPSETDLLSGPATLSPLWTDLDFAGGDVFFNSTSTSAVVTWQDAVLFGGVDPFTFQAELKSDGSFRFVYDERVAAELGTDTPPALVGASPGNGATGPGETSLLDLIDGLGDTGSEGSVYEVYFFGNDFDLGGFALDFAPNGNGGFAVTSECARSFETSNPCARSNDAFRFTPRADGGYDVDQIDRFFEASVGADLGLIDESEVDQPLPFQFFMPGGTVVNTLRITSNGRLLDPASGTVADFSPDPATAVTDGPAICASWIDLDPGAGGTVSFDANPTRVLVTWQGVPEFDLLNSHTFQIRLFPDGSFEISILEQPLVFPAILGTFDGAGGMVPAEVDLSSTPILSTGSASVYEFIDGGGDVSDISVPLRTIEVSPAQLGGSFQMVLDGVPSGSLAAGILVGFLNPGIDIGGALPLGTPSCVLATDGALNLPLTIQPGGLSSVGAINVPNRPALSGLTLHAQGFVIDPTLNVLGLGFANGLGGRVGL